MTYSNIIRNSLNIKDEHIIFDVNNYVVQAKTMMKLHMKVMVPMV